MPETDSQTRKTTVPEGLEPSLPEETQSAFYAIGAGLGAALSLTKGYGSYDEDSGEPEDSDAETEALCLDAQKKLGPLEEQLKEWQRQHVYFVLEAYKTSLYYDASKDFEYHGCDEQERGDLLTGQFQGAYLLATTFVPNLSKLGVMRAGMEQLVEEIQKQIPLLRETASEARKYPPYAAAWRQDPEKTKHILDAHESLTEKEDVLDVLLYHLRTKPKFQSEYDAEPVGNTPRRYELVLYHPNEDPENPNHLGAVVASTLTEAVARVRKEDLEAGARIGVLVPLQKDLDSGTLVVEKAKPRIR